MKIYKLNGDLNHIASLNTVDYERDGDKIALDGYEKKDWEKIDVMINEEDKREKLVLKDYSTISEPVFSKRAVDALLEVTGEEPDLQFLPIHCIDTEEDLYIVNVTKIVDCIDYNNSEMVYYSSGRIMYFEKYCFIPEKVKDLKIFKLVDEPVRKPFVTDEFAKKIEEHKLTGFKLELVWDSDNA